MPTEPILEVDFSTMPCALSDGPSNIADFDGSLAKTCLDCSVQTEDRTSLVSLEKWLAPILPHHRPNGKTSALSSARLGSPSGAFWTHSGSEWRSVADGSLPCVISLSQILELGFVPARFYLSPIACAGILRRADKRGKTLPEHLARALRAVADLARTSTSLEESKPVSEALTKMTPPTVALLPTLEVEF